MRTALLAACAALAGCQAVPNKQPPVLLTGRPMIVVRHNGGGGEGVCPMWVKINGEVKGELLEGRSLAAEVPRGVHTVALGRSASGVYGRGVVCTGSMQTTALVSREFEVGDGPVKVAYEMHGTGKRWIPIAGLFLRPTPALVPDTASD